MNSPIIPEDRSEEVERQLKQTRRWLMIDVATRLLSALLESINRH